MNDLFKYYNDLKDEREKIDEIIKSNTHQIIALFENNLDDIIYESSLYNSDNKARLYEYIIRTIEKVYSDNYNKKVVRNYLIRKMIIPRVYKKRIHVILTFILLVSFTPYFYSICFGLALLYSVCILMIFPLFAYLYLKE